MEAAKSGIKSKYNKDILLGMKQGEVFPYLKVVDLREGPININREKSKLARSMESRMTQLRRDKTTGFQLKKFTNKSFASMLESGEIVCGTVLTCVSTSNETAPSSDTDIISSYINQMLDLRTDETMPLVRVVDPKQQVVDMEQERTDIVLLAESCVNAVRDLYAARDINVAFDISPFTSMLASGEILFGTIIRRVQ